MKKTALMIGITTALAISSSAAFAANANTTQKGSLLIFPKIDVREDATTWVRIVNDNNGSGSAGGVAVKCYFMDVNKNRNDLEFFLTAHQPLVLAVVGNYDVPKSPRAKTAFFPDGPGYGEMVCFAVSSDGTGLANFNQLSGTATVVKSGAAVEYNAWAFKYNGTGAPPAGDLVLNGTAYDSCPAYLFGQFSPKGSPAPTGDGDKYGDTWINISSCKQDLRQDYQWNVTKLLFEVWNYKEDKLTGGYECANSFFEDYLEGIQVSPRFSYAQLKAPAYYRVQGVASTQCDAWKTGVKSAATGLVGVQTSFMGEGQAVAAELAAGNTPATGLATGFVKWDAFGGLTGGK